jgi:hypothetical protein
LPCISWPWFDLQLDALNSCSFTYNTFIKVLFMFQAVSRSLINVLYVNKQEFSASSWRPNQGYTEMQGQPTIKMYFLVYLSVSLFPNSYLILFWEFYFLIFFHSLYMPKPT